MAKRLNSNQDDVYYEALRTRDHRFDGKFFVGVKTTGIYCRPICPAKPKRENVEFFRTHLEAERAGYRPCLRCRPESAPQSPAWIGTSALVRRAVKRLSDHAALDRGEDHFAEGFGVSARHLRRLFVDEIGKTPKQLAIESRLALARQLLIETSLPISEIVFASGFQSIRRFNDAFKARFKRSPSLIRRSPLKPGAGLMLSLPYRPPFDFAGLLRFYRTHRIGDLEWFEGEKMYRAIEHEGKTGSLTIADDPARSRLLLEVDFPDTAVLHTVVSRVRQMFDLDSDPLLIANSLESDRQVKRMMQTFPGIRLPTGWDPFEVGVSTILGQLVSVDRARALIADLIAIAGHRVGAHANARTLRFFPTPTELAIADLGALKTTAIRKQTLKRFAAAVASGELSLDPAQDVDEFTKRVLAIKGIGPWTASLMAMRVLRHTDAFPETDLILARALEKHSRSRIQAMSPWRGYAAALFWRQNAQTPYTATTKKQKAENHKVETKRG